MRLHVVRVYFRGVKLSERELRQAEGVVGDVRIQTTQQPDGRSRARGHLYGADNLQPATAARAAAKSAMFVPLE